MTDRTHPDSEGRMIFITGASRSGTTLMSFILRRHSRIFGLREMHYFGETWDPRESRGAPDLDERALIAAAARIYARQEYGILSHRAPGKAHLQRAHALLRSLPRSARRPGEIFAAAVRDLSREAGKEIPCEQTPRNIFYAEALLQAYPNARIVHMMRDPRAVMASQKRRWRRRSLSAGVDEYPRYHTLREWINYHPYTAMNLWVRASREAQRLAATHPRFSIARFEGLLNDPEQTVRRVCHALEIGFEPQMLDVEQINSSHQSSVGGARKGIHRDAMHTWKNTLSRGELVIAERLCHDIMIEQGYEPLEPRHARNAGEVPYLLSYPFHLAGVLAVNPRRAWIQSKAALRAPLKRTMPAAK